MVKQCPKDNMFKYEEYYVKKEVSHFVKKLWTLDNLANPSAVPGKAILPNGCFNIAVIEGNGIFVKHREWEKHLDEGVYFCGQATEAVTIDISPNTKATMVQLHAWTPVHFVISDISALTNSIVPLYQLGLSSLTDLNHLPGLDNTQIYRYIITAFRPLFQVSAISNLITLGTQMIFVSNGNITIAEMAETLNCTSRYLQKLFKRHIGLSPKDLSVIVKLREAVDGIAYPDLNIKSLTRLALVNQFYDQAHFNNTFQRIVKTSPKKFNVPDYLLALKK